MNYREEDKLIYDIIMSLQDRQQATQKALSRSSSSNTAAAAGSASAAQGQRSPAAAGSAAQRQQRGGGESKSRSAAASPGSPDSTTGYVEQLHFSHLCVCLSMV